MTEIPDSYEPDRIESKWQDEWADSDVYSYDANADDAATEYVIDTPPPYPTGNLHIGHGLQWCYIDLAARFHRLRGENVLFPQGWDCHGLPTEVKVEENEGIHRTEVSREEFRDLCIEYTEDQIDSMKETMTRLGFSIDWDHEFRTMDPEYWGKTQRSFVEMSDSVYRDEHPVNWCPRCETAIADAEVEKEDRTGTLYYVTFDGVGNDVDEQGSSGNQNSQSSGDDIEIATTRPELLAACVGMAVDPDDERYEDRIGETFEVPLFGQEVELVADDDVDGEFGTGAVMICTFGDKQDVDWWTRHDLDLRPVFTEDGRLNELADGFEGQTIDEAKRNVADRLEEEGYLNESEPTEQSVGVCWRCDTPIEILSKEQWFVEIDKESILEKAAEVDWIPEHMHARLEEWTEGMDWDWVISRQRVFATPIPAWECESCDHWHIAGVEDLPVDPTETDPAAGDCPECGASDWRGETDVMDTWMDSSITPLHLTGWPDDLDLDEFEPVALRPQGHDIIRTWAFYTLLRTGELTGQRPWNQVLVNGMVFGPDGNKMSKSRGNVVTPEDAVSEYGADSVRQALVLGGQPGSDVQFQPKEATSASRFLTKVWNITRFASNHVDEETPRISDPAYRDADRWILSKCARVAESVDEQMEAYRYDEALRELREFVWHDLADDYLELIKGRLYDGRPGERNAARHALFTALSASLRMLSPFSPFVTEELYAAIPGTEGSVHDASWPEIDAHDDEAERAGEIIVEIASGIRAWKSEEGMALNAELDRVEVYLDDSDLRHPDSYDLSGTINGPVHVKEGRPAVELVPVGVDPDHSTIGPEFRDRAGAVIGALESTDPAELQAQKTSRGEVTLDAGGEEVTLDGDAFEVTEEYRAESGEEVEVLETEHATVLVFA